METLYRKYRPIDFSLVVGQDMIVKTLKNQIIKGSTCNAYLFSGTRGTGKTTLAKIFARALNCPNEKNGEPCNECDICKAALSGNDLNICELDAASNNSIEDIRRINEQIAYPPINGEKKKVFIIDEVHALSKPAQQAFLKILEEPPEYVVYILATTDPNKLSETILSRCQKYNFKRITINDIVYYLRQICDKEKIDIDDEALTFIAEKSDGSMRESISKLDRCRSYAAGTKFTKETVVDILGLVSDDEYRKLLNAINVSDIENSFAIINSCIEKGKDIVEFVNNFIWYLRNVLICKDLKNPVETLNITKGNFEKLKKDGENIDREVLIYFIEELSRTSNSMKDDENRRVILETAIIRLSTPETNFNEAVVMARLKNIEKTIKEKSFVNVAKNYISDDKVDEPNERSENENQKSDVIKEVKLSKATYEETKKIIENWNTITSVLDNISKTVLRTAKLIPQNGEAEGYINVVVYDYDIYDIMDEDRIKKVEEKLQNFTREQINKEVIYKILNKSETNYADKVNLLFENAKNLLDIEIGVEGSDDK